MTGAKLSERRKADRVQMANLLSQELVEAGATVTVDTEWMEHCPRAIMLHIIAPGGAYVDVDFDGDSPQPDTFVATWNLTHEARKAGVQFGMFGDVNPWHRAKAARVAYGFDNLRTELVKDVISPVSY